MSAHNVERVFIFFFFFFEDARLFSSEMYKIFWFMLFRNDMHSSIFLLKCTEICAKIYSGFHWNFITSPRMFSQIPGKLCTRGYQKYPTNRKRRNRGAYIMSALKCTPQFLPNARQMVPDLNEIWIFFLRFDVGTQRRAGLQFFSFFFFEDARLFSSEMHGLSCQKHKMSARNLNSA